MPKEAGTQQMRISVPFFEGVNSSVQHTIARKTELAHMENARAPVIGVLEKREGQAALGTDTDGGVFESLGNFGLVYWVDSGSESQGLLRVTTVNGTVANIYYLNVGLAQTNYELVSVSESLSVVLVYPTSLFDSVTVTESVQLVVVARPNVFDSVTITEDFAKNIV